MMRSLGLAYPFSIPYIILTHQNNQISVPHFINKHTNKRKFPIPVYRHDK